MPFKNQDFHYNRDSSVSLARLISSSSLTKNGAFSAKLPLKRRNSALFLHLLVLLLLLFVVVVFAIYFIHVQKYTNMLN